MIEFLSMEVEGFCSIDNFNINLNDKHIIWVRGANGFGKSTLISALVWGLYGKTLKGVSNVNTWVKNQTSDYKGTKVVINYRVGNKIHRVVRFQNYTGDFDGAKGGSRLIYYIEAQQVSEKQKNQIQTLIQNSIGLSYNLFLNTVVFGQGMKRIAQESASEQKDIFEEMFDLRYISKAKDKTMAYLSDANDDLHKAQSELRMVESSISQVESYIRELGEKKDSQKETLERKVSSLKSSLNSMKEEYKKLKKEGEGKDLEELEEKLEALKQRKSNLMAQLKSINELEKTNLTEFVDKMYSLLTNKKIEEALRILVEYRDKVQGRSDILNKIQSVDSKISIANNDIIQCSRQQSRLTQYRNNISHTKSEIQTIKDSSNIDYDELINKQVDKLTNLQGKKQEFDKEVQKIQKKVDIYDWANKIPFGNKGIKAFLFSSSLDEINGYLDAYSKVIGFYVKLYVDLNSVKKDFKILISLDGTDVEYDELSGGQKQLVNITIAFAMNQTLASMRGINIAFLDEVFESLSHDNIEIVTNLISTIYRDKTLFLITHQDSLPLSNHKVLQVDKTKGRSEYKFI